jgi:transposase
MSKPRSKLPKRQLDKLTQESVLGLPAFTAAQFASVHRNTSTKYYKCILLRIASDSTRVVTRLAGETELDGLYFGGVRKGKRGRAAAGKQIVFGILERGGQVRTVMVGDVTAATLMDEIPRNTEKGCVYYTEVWKVFGVT